MTNVVIVAGEGEYHSNISMRAVQGDLADLPGMSVTFCEPDVLDDQPDFPPSHFDNLNALDDADLLIIYTRFRSLPEEQLAIFGRYLDRGGPIVGLRTSTHAFHAAPGSPWNDFGATVLGSPWISHHGHGSSTVVSRRPGVAHPVLDGVPAQFAVRSWLYDMKLAPGCIPLLQGDPVNPEHPPQPSPVAWTTDHRGGRVFYTSLGHPADFGVPAFRRLLVSAVRWCVE